MPVEPGVYANILNEDYHRGDAISKTGLDNIRRSPAHYKAAQEYRIETPAMRAGTAIHTIVLEPHEFDKRYIVAPDNIDRRTKKGKEAWAEFQEEAGRREVITADEYAQWSAIRDAVYSVPAARRLLKANDALAEHTIIAREPEHGVLAQCRPDLWLRESGIMVDLKTAQDASPEGFAKSSANYRYYVQAAWYPDVLAWATGEATRAFIFIAVEKQPPYAVGIYHVSPGDNDTHPILMKGFHEYQEDLAVYAECLRKDEWPAYSPKIQPLQLPQWAMRKQYYEARKI